MLSFHKKRLFCKSFLIILGLFLATNSYAASLSFSPATGNFTAGNVFKISVLVDSENQAINSAETAIAFPSDLLEVQSVSKTNSIFSFWVQGPSFSNISGNIDFSGGLPTPGFNGSKGNLIDIIFKVKKSGQASLLFTPGAVRANDGLGTNVLNNIGQGLFTLGSQQAPETPPENIKTPAPSPSSAVPGAPEISSVTNPNQNSWGNNPNPSFTWKLSSDITSVRILYDKFPSTNPSVVYSPAISQKTLSGLADGTYYFHVQFRNANGWGAVSNFKFQIDTKNPETFTVTEIRRDDETIPQARFTFNATDVLSGIDRYEIQIDGGTAIIWSDDGSHIYQTSAIGAGKHTLFAKAFDKAGNFLTASSEFNVVAIQSPKITEYSETLATSENLSGEGETYPLSKVKIWLQREGGEPQSFEVQSDEAGKFIFTSTLDLEPGKYTLWSEVLDSHGAISPASEKLTFTIESASFIQATTRAIGFWGSILLPIIIVILLFITLWYVWHKFLHLKRVVQKETYNAEVNIRKAFSLLGNDLRNQINELNKIKSERDLSVIKNIRKSLDDAENLIEKEIKDIDKRTIALNTITATDNSVSNIASTITQTNNAGGAPVNTPNLNSSTNPPKPPLNFRI